MVRRLSELPEVEARHLSPERVQLPTYDDTPLLPGKPLAERRVAIISTAGLHKRGDRASRPGDGSYRIIPAETQAKIFIPNFTTKTSGTGLGLAMSKGIVEQARGEIWFETADEKGTTFFVSLPLLSVETPPVEDRS